MRVLVPMDGSEQSWKALEYAEETFPEATLVVLRVISPVDMGYGIGEGAAGVANERIETERQAAERMFESVRDTVGDVETETEIGQPARTICAAAENFDQVVIGSHGREGISRILVGSVAETVVRRSPVPVTVVR